MLSCHGRSSPVPADRILPLARFGGTNAAAVRHDLHPDLCDRCEQLRRLRDYLPDGGYLRERSVYGSLWPNSQRHLFGWMHLYHRFRYLLLVRSVVWILLFRWYRSIGCHGVVLRRCFRSSTICVLQECHMHHVCGLRDWSVLYSHPAFRGRKGDGLLSLHHELSVSCPPT